MRHRDDSLTTGHHLRQLGTFLRSRRVRLTPHLVGLPDIGRRRTAGLRREEVARLAGISAAWYTYLEQGRDVHPSREVLDALCEALRLDAGERAYLFQLAYGPRGAGDRRAATASPWLSALHLTPSLLAPDGTPPSLRRVLDALGPTPALVIDRCWDVVSRNAAIVAVLPSLGPERTTPDAQPQNLVEYVLTDAALQGSLRDWAQVARLAVDGLRASLAGVPADDPLSAHAAALVVRLTAVSPEFRAWWPAHGLWAADRPVTHVYEHPQVGRLEFEGTMFDVRSAPGLTLITYVPCDPESTVRMRDLTAARR